MCFLVEIGRKSEVNEISVTFSQYFFHLSAKTGKNQNSNKIVKSEMRFSDLLSALTVPMA